MVATAAMDRLYSANLERSASDLSDASTFDGAREQKGAAHRAGDGEDLLEDAKQADFITGIWGVIYTVGRENKAPWVQVIFKLVLDCLQLLLLTINPLYGWNINGSASWWKVVSFVQLDQFMTERGIPFFLACLYILSVLLIATAALCVWVAHAYQRNRFDIVWPITIITWFSIIFFQILDIASMNLFFMVMDCQYTASSPDVQYHNREFPDMQCWSMPFMIHVIVGAMSVLLFVVMATLFRMGEMETDLTTKNPLAMAHSKVEVIGFLLRFFMTACSVFVTNLKWLSICYTLAAWLLVYLYSKWVPHYSNWVNIIRSGSYGAVFYSAVIMAVLTWATGVDQDDMNAVSSWSNTCTIALIAGLVPAALAAAALAHLRLRYLLDTVVGKFRLAQPEHDINLVHSFSDPREVEICARCLRVWVPAPDGGQMLDSPTVELAEVIIKVGIVQFKSDAYAHILFAGYLVDVRKSMQSSLIQISLAKKSCPNILERFAIFSLEQQQVQTVGNTGSDRLSYVQMQRNLRLATKVYNDSLQAMSNFWQLLLQHEVQLEHLIICVKDVDTMVKTADMAYKDLIQSSMENWKILKVYAKYLEVIKMDPFNGAQWDADAEEMRQSEEEGQADMFRDVRLATGQDSEEALERNRVIFDDHRCAIVINAMGTITMANKAAFKMFGCKLSDLMGKNVKILMPSPFKEHHDQFLKNYAETGKAKAIGRTVDMVAQHSDGHLFSVHLTISKISGLGMDSTFMGVLEALPETDSARAWLLGDGTVMCIANSITQWFGYENEEIAKASFLQYVVDAARLDETLKVASGTMKRDQTLAASNPTWHLDHICIKHKFLDEPISCSIDITTGGSDTQRFLLLDIRRTSPVEPVLVASNTGKIVHVSDETAALIGVSAKQLLSEGSILSLIPEPFSSLHNTFLMRGIEPDPSEIPPYACRSGLSMSLNVTGPQGIEMHPFSVSFRNKIQDLEGSTQTVITLTKRTMQEALGERCLSVLVDITGTVRQVAGGQGELFGFAPEEILNKPVSSFLDILNIPDPQSNASTGDDFTAKALRELASRSVKHPGEAYRVGVSRPFGSDADAQNEFLSDIVSHLRSVMKIPAILKAALHCSDKNITRLQEGYKVAASTPFFDLSQISSSIEGGFMIELQLWKADIMTGVLVLDEQGLITSTSLSPLYPAELIFGTSSSNMVKRHINNFLPLHDRPIGELFDPITSELGRQSVGGPKKGGMKMKDNSWLRKGPGVINQLSAVHCTDGQALVLNVQAVAIKGKRGSMGLIVHLHKPVVGNATRPFLPPPQKGSAAQAFLEAPSLPSARAPSPRSLPFPGKRSLSHSLKAPSVKMEDSCDLQRVFEALADDEPDREVPEAPEPPSADAAVAMPATLHDPDDSAHGLLAARGSSADLPKLMASQPSITHHPPLGRDSERMLAWVTKDIDVSVSPPDKGPPAWVTRDTNDSSWMPPDKLAQQLQCPSDADDDNWEQSNGGNAASTLAGDSGVGAEHYKRGKRLKRLLRLLTGAAARRVINRFFLKAAAMAIFVCAVNVACSIAAYMLILNQSAMVLSMQNMGSAAGALGKIAIYINNLLLLFSNSTAPWLTNLRSFDDMPYHLGRLNLHIQTFTTLHRDTYAVIQDLPQSNSYKYARLHALWNDPVLPITTILPSSPITTSETVNASLWDAGQAVINKATFVWQNTPLFPANVVNATSYGNWYDVRYILDNTQATLVPAYTESMDNFLEVVLSEAESVNSIHYYFLVIEGCVASTLALLVMLVITTQVVVYRWNIYNVFMMVPTTIIRTIATKVVEMMEDGREGEAELHQTAMEMPAPDLRAMDKQNKEMRNDHHPLKGNINLAASSTMLNQDTSVIGILKSTFLSLKFWGKRKRVSPLSGKRTLVRSFRPIAWFLLPFALWGLMMIVINVTAHQQLSEVASPIALFNLVNYNIVEFYNNQVFLQTLTIEPDVTRMPELRLHITSMLPTMESDYMAMLHGGAAVLDDSTHVKHVKNGILSTAFGKELMYQTRACVRQYPNTCLQPSDPLYGYTRTGVDAMLNRYFEVLKICIAGGGLAPYVSSPEFNFIYTVYWDISGGLLQLGDSFYGFVISAYKGVMQTHIIGLVVTMILMAGFALFILWPFVKTCKAEGKRIADLLSQLPTDIDVEALVRKAAMTGAASVSGSMSLTSK